MTLDDALRIATALHSAAVPSGVAKLAAFVVDNLGEAFPCGYVAPIGSSGTVYVTDSAIAGENPEPPIFEFTPSEARAYAAALLRAADQAELSAPKDSDS